VGVDDVFYGGIIALRVVLAFEVVAEKAGEALPHEGAEAALQFLHDAISGPVGLSVDEADQDHALPNGEFAQLTFKPGFQRLFALFNDGLAFFGRFDVGEFGFQAVHRKSRKFSIGPDFDDPLFQSAVSSGARLCAVVGRNDRTRRYNGFAQLHQGRKAVWRSGMRLSQRRRRKEGETHASTCGLQEHRAFST